MTDNELENRLHIPDFADAIHHKTIYSGVINNNPIQETLDSFDNKKKNILLEIFNIRLKKFSQQQLEMEDFDKALTYLVPKELQPKESIKVNDGVVTYEELAEVARKVEAISNKDEAFDKMPRIFIYPKFPDKNTNERYIVDRLDEEKLIPYFSYISDVDSINMHHDELNNTTKQEVLAAFAHEYGHRIYNANGSIKLKHNLDKHSEFILGEKISDICSDVIKEGDSISRSSTLETLHYLRSFEKEMAKEGKNNNCTAKISELNNQENLPKILSSINDIGSINSRLSHQEEFTADITAALADREYALSLIKHHDTHNANDSIKHPSSNERINTIKEIIADPIAGKERYEKMLAENRKTIDLFREYASNPTPADNKTKTAPTTPIPPQNQSKTQPLP